MTTFSNTPHLVVVREVNPNDGTQIHEFWQIESYNWHDGTDAHDDPVVKCHVARWSGTRDTARDGLPLKDKRASDTCSWDETPQEIRDAFRQEIEKMAAAMQNFESAEEE